VRLVRTDVAGFVGFAERGPLPPPGAIEFDARQYAVRLTSWEEYQATFGGFTPHGCLPYSVRAFFENGGTTCYVVRVAATDHEDRFEQPQAASLAIPGALGISTALTVTAVSAGNWGNRINLAVTPAGGDEFSLRVRLVPGRRLSRQGVEEEFYHRLSLDEKNPFFVGERVNRLSRLIRVEVNQGQTSPLFSAGTFARGPVWLEGGRDGLRGLRLRDVIGTPALLRGLRLLEEIDEVAILCIPDAVCERPAALPPRPVPLPDPCAPAPDPCAPLQVEKSGGASVVPDTIAEDETAMPPALDAAQIYQAMIDQCERLKDRVAILDTPAQLRTPAQVVRWRELFNTRFAALYFPWLKVPDPLELTGTTRRVPPSGHIAGIYARIDSQFGVQRPPANAALDFVTDVAEEIDDRQQENLNPFGVNAVRAFAGRGIRVWGARSLAGPGDSDWRFIHARRLMSMIEESVEDSMQWTAFEPNDDSLRRTVVHSLSVFLETIWRTGGLKGALPSEGFYVKCDETNNPPAVVEAGQLICEVGVAVAAPMEFLVFELRQQPDGAEIVEP
jgi:hypothetical protein